MRNLSLVVLVVLCLSAAAPAQTPLNAGPILGHADTSAATIWLQTAFPARVQLRFWPLREPAADRLSEPLETTREGDELAVFRLTDLPPGRRFGYQVYLEGRPVALGFPAEFQTLAVDAATRPRDASFVVGSCCFVNDPFGPPGYGGEYEIFGTIHRDRPGFMVWLGDNVYFRSTDWGSEQGMRRRYRVDRHNLTACWPLWASCHHYAIWDDHDYGPNDSDASFGLKQVSRTVFQDYWPGDDYGVDGHGLYYRFRWGDLEFFMLDDRTFRSPDDYPIGPEKRMLGRDQMLWLKQSLVSSHAAFKFVCSGSQVLNPICAFEGWGLYPAERQELVEFIAQARVPGVIFLSGDRHATELIRVQPQGCYPLYDLTSSPLTSSPLPVEVSPSEVENPARVAGTRVNARNYCLVQVTGPAGERRLHVTCKDARGRVRWDYEIPQMDLRFPLPPRG